MRRRGLTLLELLVVLTILIALSTIVVPVIGTFGRKSQDVATRENLLRLQELINNRYLADMGNELPRPGSLGLAAGRKNHPQLRYLFVNPDTEDIVRSAGTTLFSARRWQGPYIRHSGSRYQIHDAGATPPDGIDPSYTDAYGLGDDDGSTPPRRGDPAVLDAWGRPVVIQEPSTHGSYTPNATDRTYARLVSAGPDGAIDTPLTVLMPTEAQRGDDIVVFLFRHDEYGPDLLTLE